MIDVSTLHDHVGPPTFNCCVSLTRSYPTPITSSRCLFVDGRPIYGNVRLFVVAFLCENVDPAVEVVNGLSEGCLQTVDRNCCVVLVLRKMIKLLVTQLAFVCAQGYLFCHFLLLLVCQR